MITYCKCLALAVVTMQAVVSAHAARNLITNFDHRERVGVDIPMGWTKHIRRKLVTTLDYISFMPYYVESPDEPAEIAAVLGWKDANRVRDGK